MTRGETTVVGAGPAGLVAAITLRREGRRVIVREKEKRIGGNPEWHPSVHDTPVAVPGLWDYVGIDASECFQDGTPNFRCYVGGEKVDVPPRAPLWVVERGPRETSLDAFLFRLAEREGVEFELGRPVTAEDLRSAPAGTIVATGLAEESYVALGLPYAIYAGYWAAARIEPGPAAAAIYFGGHSKEYGYTSSANGLWYVLLFSRREVAPDALAQFQGLVERSEGKSFARWNRFVGYTPRRPQLFFEDRLVLTGTLAGVVEPAIGFGITGALLSGKIAALAVLDRQRGEAEFARFTGWIPGAIARKKDPWYLPNFQLGRTWFELPEAG